MIYRGARTKKYENEEEESHGGFGRKCFRPPPPRTSRPNESPTLFTRANVGIVSNSARLIEHGRKGVGL